MPRDAVGLLYLLLGASPAMSAELVIRDLGVRGESLPTAFNYSADSEGFSRSGTDYFRTAFGVALGGRYSLAGPGRSWGPILGCDLALADARSDHAHLTSAEVRGIAGLAWQTDFRLTCIAQCSAGIGYGRMIIDRSGGPSLGQMGSLTPGVGLWWRSTEKSYLILDVGWRLQGAVLHRGETAIDLRQSGASVAVGITWGISRAPWSLE